MTCYKSEDSVLMMFNRFYHMCTTREQRTLALDMKHAFLELPTTDVVPKSEVDDWIITAKENLIRIEELEEELKNIRAEIAREIFEEIKKALYHLETPMGKYLVINNSRLAELETKYPEETK